MVLQYLKEKTYYNDLYDSMTVRQCRELRGRFLKRIKDRGHGKNESPRLSNRIFPAICDFILYHEAGERYAKKAEAIKEWMENDRQKDLKLEETPEPQTPICQKCNARMALDTKDLMNHGGKEQILFLYRCPCGCLPGRGIYEDGSEFIHHHSCPKCGSGMDMKHQRKGKLVITILTCLACKHTEKETLDLEEPKDVPDPNHQKDREKFCLDEKRGQEYLAYRSNLEHCTELMKEIDEREKSKALYDKVAKIKKVGFGEIQKILTSAIAKSGYHNLQFQSPQMGRDVTVEFTAVDGKSARGEFASRQELKKVIQNSLADYNWRLMSERISYRMGFVTGRIRGVENEEQMAKLFDSNN